MYKLFINNKTVYLVTNPSRVENVLSHDNEYIIIPYRNKKDLQNLLENVLFKDTNKSDCIIFGKDPEIILKELLSLFECLEAAGGLVENDHAETLLIFRRGFWDLPKGKAEDGESIEETALREVEEETGLTGLSILHPITFKGLENKATYHSYLLKGKHAMKISHWFLMHTSFKGDLIPQTDEDIEQAIWVPKNKLPDYFDGMYLSIIDVLKNR